MSLDENDCKMAEGVFNGRIDVVKAALAAGANVNGTPEQPLAPIATATIANHAGMVEFLLERGADPDKPVTIDLTAATPGERALHIAARGGYVEIARLLLEAGADPTLAEERGFLPLHYVALKGHLDMVDMLYSRAPATLNVCADMGQTPLLSACCGDQEKMVSKLLSMGAMQRIPAHETDTSPLMMAAGRGLVGVMRVLINEGGIWAVGGSDGLSQALYMAVHFKRTTILRLLLAAVGDNEDRPSWANTSNAEGTRLLHNGAGLCYPAAVSILLEAGADEAARDTSGRTPLDVIGAELGREDKVHRMYRGKEVAVRRMLQRGPAYRARSWAWPSDAEEADTDGGGGRGTAAAAAAAVLSSPPAMKTAPVIGVRIFRPKEKSSGKFFVTLIGR
ncbi:unnamed protein product [Laminaria digitata]